jgi:NTF2 fold immunity protein
MRLTLALSLLLSLFIAAANGQREHRNYVPDQKTAARVAEAILVGQYGEERVHAQLPLVVDGANKDYWIVQGNPHEKLPSFGGGIAVWINKHSGCIQGVVEHMK